MAVKETKLIIDVIDRSDWVGKFTGVFHPDAISINGVIEMVDRIISKANEEGGQKTIFRLNIIGHGTAGIQSVGGGPAIKEGKYLDVDVLRQHSHILGRLRPYFRVDAVVTLHGCQVASGEKGSLFLQQFSLIVGVPVQAGERTQRPLIPGMEGPIKRCTPINCGSPNDSMLKGSSNTGGVKGIK
jgi:hypothetical protein